MIAKYKTKAFVWSVPGMIMQGLGIAGMLAEKQATEEMDPVFAAILLFFIGTALLVFGLYFYTLAKNQRPAWSLAGLAGLPGFLAVHFLSDNNRAQPAKKKKKK